MGWLWNINTYGIDKMRPGWRPGAVLKCIKDYLCEYLNPCQPPVCPPKSDVFNFKYEHIDGGPTVPKKPRNCAKIGTLACNLHDKNINTDGVTDSLIDFKNSKKICDEGKEPGKHGKGKKGKGKKGKGKGGKGAKGEKEGGDAKELVVPADTAQAAVPGANGAVQGGNGAVQGGKGAVPGAKGAAVQGANGAVQGGKGVVQRSSTVPGVNGAIPGGKGPNGAAQGGNGVGQVDNRPYDTCSCMPFDPCCDEPPDPCAVFDPCAAIGGSQGGSQAGGIGGGRNGRLGGGPGGRGGGPGGRGGGQGGINGDGSYSENGGDDDGLNSKKGLQLKAALAACKAKSLKAQNKAHQLAK